MFWKTENIVDFGSVKISKAQQLDIDLVIDTIATLHPLAIIFYSVSRYLVHSIMMMRAFSYLILLCLTTSAAAASYAGQRQYIIKPSQQSRSSAGGSGAACSLRPLWIMISLSLGLSTTQVSFL